MTGNIGGAGFTGQFYYFGEGIKKNKSEAIKYLKIAAKGNDILSKVLLCDYYLCCQEFDRASNYLKEVLNEKEQLQPLMPLLEFLKNELKDYIFIASVD